MSIESTVVCDQCQRESAGFVAPTKAHHIRAVLRAAGWQVGERGGRDYCAECREQTEREA